MQGLVKIDHIAAAETNASSDANDPSATLSALARDQPAQSIAEERNRVRGFYLLPETDDIRGQTPNAESYQLFMMPEAAAALHRPLISYQAIFTIAHARESAIPEVVFDV